MTDITQFPNIDYTNRDYQTILASLEAQIRRKFPDTWKDFRDSAVGMAFTQLVAYVFDVLSYYLDVRANETFLPTAKDRISIINLGRLVGYKLAPASSASVLVTATISSTQAAPVIIAAGTPFLSITNNVPFIFLEEGRIEVGETSAQIIATQGAVHSDTFTSDGSAFQRFVLSVSQVLDGTTVVDVNGVEWTEVESLVFADENSTVYEVLRDENDFATIKFGDGDSGFVPPPDAVIDVAYRVGGGVQGNLALNEIDTTVQGSLEGVLPVVSIDVALTNPDETGSGGEDRESIAHAKFFMPKSVKTNGRAVTQEDFETLASLFNDSTFGSPSYASAKLKQLIPELNTVVVSLWSRDSSGAISDDVGTGLISAVQAYFDNNGPGAVRLVSVDTEVQAGTNVYIDVTARVKAASAFSPSTVVTNARAAVSAYFNSVDFVRPGEDVRISLLNSQIVAAQGVAYVTITNIRATLKVTELAGTGDGTTTQFQFTSEELPVVFSVRITSGEFIVTDDGAGNLQGDVDPTGINTVDYDTGAIDVTFPTAPAATVEVNEQYRYILTYQRGELESIANGTSAHFTGSLDFPPAVPGTVAFSDGTQVVYDDGDGNLIGAVYDAGRIDYTTGFYDFTFQVAPAAGAELRTTYVQYLSTASQDLPITKEQLPVESVTTITPILSDTTD